MRGFYQRAVDRLDKIDQPQLRGLFRQLASDNDLLGMVLDSMARGIIATNTTIRRDHLKTQILPATGKPVTEEAGGISGAPLRQRSTDIIRFIYQKTNGTLPIIGVGGIFTADDAWEKITAGASLLQL